MITSTDFYVRDFLSDKSSSQISWIGSTQVFLLMGAGLFTGRLFDRGYLCAFSIILVL